MAFVISIPRHTQVSSCSLNDSSYFDTKTNNLNVFLRKSSCFPATALDDVRSSRVSEINQNCNLKTPNNATLELFELCSLHRDYSFFSGHSDDAHPEWCYQCKSRSCFPIILRNHDVDISTDLCTTEAIKHTRRAFWCLTSYLLQIVLLLLLPNINMKHSLMRSPTIASHLIAWICFYRDSCSSWRGVQTQPTSACEIPLPICMTCKESQT